MAIRLLIGDDHGIIRAGLYSLFRGTDVEIVGDASSGAAVLRLIEKLHPDVVLLDVRMPDGDGLTALTRLKADYPDTPILMWSAFDNPAFAAATIELGASGFLLKSVERAQLLTAIRRATAGEMPSRRTGRKLIADKRQIARIAADGQIPLSTREREVLKQLATGATNHEIARTLGLASATVKMNVRRIFWKIGVTDRTQAAVWAARHNQL